ncbi:MAG: AAA domain-containing protein [Bacteroidales bacterium]|nr:AAA domain-containing protein [Bacteroidales bacterium]
MTAKNNPTIFGSQSEQLEFYTRLLNKELESIDNNALKVAYIRYEISRNVIRFYLDLNASDCSKAGDIQHHVCEGNDVNSEGFSYVVGSSLAAAPGKMHFVGFPYKFDGKCLCIKDCEGLGKQKFPKRGFLKENTSVKRQEKERQLKAISMVEKGESPNPNLVYFLFHPQELPKFNWGQNNLNNVYQKDANGCTLRYNDNQVRSILSALQNPYLAVIQGPPGTGKTTVITEIVFQILAKEPTAKILITSQTNNAVDQVRENLIAKNISGLRLEGITRARDSRAAAHTITHKLQGWKDQVCAQVAKTDGCAPMSESQRVMQQKWLDAVQTLDEDCSAKQHLIDSIRVIGATCNHIASSKYEKYDFQFDYVIMDESGKATVAESLVPIVRGKKLIFVGDHRQLRPMLTAEKQVESWLREQYRGRFAETMEFDEYINQPSLFEQVIEQVPAAYKTQLTECRRLSKMQVELTSRCFYESAGDEPIVSAKQSDAADHGFPFSVDTSVIFLDIKGDYSNKKDKNESSYNERSAQCIQELLLRLNSYAAAQTHTYGVITGYKAQAHKLCGSIYSKAGELENILRGKHDADQFTISVIDRFQGLERDVVIVDLVKSGVDLSLGFLEIPNRINVALSRQKKLLVIVGDYQNLLNAKTLRLKGERAALQNYLSSIPTNCVFSADNLNSLFVK